MQNNLYFLYGFSVQRDVIFVESPFWRWSQCIANVSVKLEWESVTLNASLAAPWSGAP